jgi:hypothetical protein
MPPHSTALAVCIVNEIRDQILELIAKTEAVIPSVIHPDLPPGPNTSGAPEWYAFEHQVWNYGEEIRQLLTKNKSLNNDNDIQQAILKIACNKKAKRGRQTFILLLGRVDCARFAQEIASQLLDQNVAGHAIDTISKMRSPGFTNEIEPFTKDKVTWVRNKAKQYIKKYGNS